MPKQCPAFAALVLAAFVLVFLPSALAQTPDREICITVDDLPGTAANSMTGKELIELNSKIVATLHDRQVPAVGFVNESRLYFRLGEVDDRIKSLSIWPENGIELGNHTFNHASLNQVSLAKWEEDTVRGETVTKILLAQHGMTLRYFRHPYLETGRDLQTRREAEAFLVSRGYRIAPVTVDAWDWMFDRVYSDAHKRGDAALERKLADAYLAYTTDEFDYTEKLSRDLIGYEPRQILLLHATWLEADHLGELLDLLRKRGYKFISLHDALMDSAYSMPDEFVGEEGGSWVEHWAITRGHPPQGSPAFPQWVLDLAAALPKKQAEPSPVPSVVP